MDGSNFSVVKIVGTPTSDAWAQALSIDSLNVILWIEKREDDEELSDLSSVGKELISYLEEAFAKNPGKSLASFKELFLGMQAIAPATVSVSFVATQTVGAVIYAALKDQGKVILQRGGQIGTILSPSEEISSSSGVLHEGDVVILETEQFQKLIPQERLLEILQQRSFEEVSENIALIIHGSDDTPAAAAILLSLRGGVGLATNLRLPAVRFPLGAFLAVFLIILLLLAGFLIVREQNMRREKASSQKVLSQAQQKYEEGQSLLTLNRELSRESLRTAKTLLEEERLRFTSKDSERPFTELLGKVEEALEIALNIERIDNPSVFFDLRLMREDIEVSSLSLSGKILLVLDKKNSTIYSISLTNKSFTPLAGGLKGPVAVTLTDRFAYVLEEEGVKRIEISSKKAALPIEKEGLEDVVALVGFGGNLYALDRKNSQIVKFVPVEEGAFSRRNYLTTGARADFSKAVSMAIDGAIYVLFEDGVIKKYLSGVEDKFVLSPDTSLSHPKAFYTDKDNAFLYVFDSGDGRIVVLKKDGGYEGQYVWEGIKDVTNLVVSEEEGKILLLSGKNIYAIELK